MPYGGGQWQDWKYGAFHVFCGFRSFPKWDRGFEFHSETLHVIVTIKISANRFVSIIAKCLRMHADAHQILSSKIFQFSQCKACHICCVRCSINSQVLHWGTRQCSTSPLTHFQTCHCPPLWH
jgi:hypothetical protein